jgi:hypothetical protein
MYRMHKNGYVYSQGNECRGAPSLSLEDQPAYTLSA